MTILAHPSTLASVLKFLPPATYAFAYGSGVLAQPGLYSPQEGQAAAQAQPSNQKKGPMLDFIMAVDDPSAWHKQNIAKNPDHYSWIQKLGPEAVAAIASGVGVGVHFNPLVEIDGRMVKYGVVSTSDLRDDLQNWRWLYTAGRLHKPVVPLTQGQTDIKNLVDENRQAAAVAALLLLPSQFTTEDLLNKVVGLSYHGDIRMGWAEDPHKVGRIVAGSRDLLQELYVPLLDPHEQASTPSSAQTPTAAGTQTAQQHAAGTADQQPGSSEPLRADGSGRGAAETGVSTKSSLPGIIGNVDRLDTHTWRRPVDDETNLQLLTYLPNAILAKVAQSVDLHVPETHCEPGSDTALEIAHAIIRAGDHQKRVQQALQSTVFQASLWQGLSGAISAGGGKAVSYISAKLSKALSATAPQLKKLRS